MSTNDLDFMRDVPPVPLPEVPAIEQPTLTSAVKQAPKVRVWKIFDQGLFKIVGDEKAMLEIMKTMSPGSGITVMMINTANVDLREFFADGGLLVSGKDIK